MIAVDGCKDTAKQINAHQRKNAAAVADRSKTTDTALDTWHGTKTGSKNCKKFMLKAAPTLASFFSKTIRNLAAEIGIVLSHELMDEAVSIVSAQMNAWFARGNAQYERAARSVDGLEGQWADGVADGAKLREFACVLGATGGSDSATIATIDLSFGVDDGDEEAGGGADTDGASTDGVVAAVGAEQAMLDEVNALVRAKNLKRKKHLSEYQCLGAIDPMLGVEELRTIVSSLSNVSKADIAKLVKPKLVAMAKELLPSASVVKGGLTLEAALEQALPFIRVAFESRKKARGTKRALEDEDELLKHLAALEKEKDPLNPRECKSHPEFSSLSNLKPEFMSPRQVKAALDYFGVPLGEHALTHRAILVHVFSLDIIRLSRHVASPCGLLSLFSYVHVEVTRPKHGVIDHATTKAELPADTVAVRVDVRRRAVERVGMRDRSVYGAHTPVSSLLGANLRCANVREIVS